MPFQEPAHFKYLSFSERWQQIGNPEAQSQTNLAQLPTPSPLWPGSYTRMGASVRLRTPPPGAPEPTGGSLGSRASTQAESSCAAQRLRELRPSASAPALDASRVMLQRPDFPGMVKRGLEAMRQAREEGKRPQRRGTEVLSRAAATAGSSAFTPGSSRGRAPSAEECTPKQIRLRPKPIDDMPEQGSSVGAKSPSSKRPPSSMIRERAARLEQLKSVDPPVGQLLECLLKEFESLRFVFRQMDLNKNGQLSKAEFKDGLAALRSRTGVRPIDAHVDDLLVRLGYVGDHVVQRGALLDRLDDGDQLIERLASFLHTSKPSQLDRNKVEPRRAKLSRLLPPGDDKDLFVKADLTTLLAKLRYSDWHAGDLFQRLDKDYSGALSMEEFSGFLEGELPQRRRPWRPLSPLGSEQRQWQVQGGHAATLGSPKLAECGRRMAGEGSPKSPELGDHLATNWRTDRGCLSSKLERPDYVAIIREGLGHRAQRKGQSELLLSGQHLFTRCRDPQPDFSEICNGLRLFNTGEFRTRMDAV